MAMRSLRVRWKPSSLEKLVSCVLPLYHFMLYFLIVVFSWSAVCQNIFQKVGQESQIAMNYNGNFFQSFIFQVEIGNFFRCFLFYRN